MIEADGYFDDQNEMNQMKFVRGIFGAMDRRYPVLAYIISAALLPMWG